MWGQAWNWWESFVSDTLTLHADSGLWFSSLLFCCCTMKRSFTAQPALQLVWMMIFTIFLSFTIFLIKLCNQQTQTSSISSSKLSLIASNALHNFTLLQFLVRRSIFLPESFTYKKCSFGRPNKELKYFTQVKKNKIFASLFNKLNQRFIMFNT